MAGVDFLVTTIPEGFRYLLRNFRRDGAVTRAADDQGRRGNTPQPVAKIEAANGAPFRIKLRTLM